MMGKINNIQLRKIQLLNARIERVSIEITLRYMVHALKWKNWRRKSKLEQV